MTKIIFTVTNDLNYDQRMIRSCSALSDVDYDVLLVGRKKNNSVALNDTSFAQKRLKCIFNKGKLFYIEYNIRLFLYLLFSKFEVVVSVDLDTILSGYLVSKIKGIKQVYDAHELFTEVPELQGREKVKKFWESIEQFVLPKLKYAYTVNSSLASYFYEKYKVHFEVVMNVPEKQVESNTSRIDKNEKYILYQGAVNKGRGVLELIKAVEHIDVMLKIAGDGDEFVNIKEYVTKNKLENKVQLLGYVEPQELKQITQNAFIGINILEGSSKNYYYSLANKFFDYIYAGIPQVTMSFPEYQRINKEFEVAVLLDDIEPKVIDKAIQQLLNDDLLYAKLQKNTGKAAEVYNWNNEKKKLIRFFEKVIA